MFYLFFTFNFTVVTITDLLIFGMIFWWHFMYVACAQVYFMAKTNFHNRFRIANHHLNWAFFSFLQIQTGYEQRNDKKKPRIISFFAVLALPKMIWHREYRTPNQTQTPFRCTRFKCIYMNRKKKCNFQHKFSMREFSKSCGVCLPDAFIFFFAYSFHTM